MGHETQGRDRSDATPAEPAALPSDVQAQWDALADAARQLAAGAAGDEDGLRAAWNAMAQAARGVDHQQMLNAMHVPKDAGEQAEALAAMLRRIPNGWGRWISCDRGWYALLVELDRHLSALLPSYVIHQVKEKFGGLRYYWEPGELIRDPSDPEPPTPGRGGSEETWARWSREHDAWSERVNRYLDTPEGKRRAADRARRVALAEQLVGAAEKRASVSCESCGAPGRLHRTRSRGTWYKTLCRACAERADYVPAE